MEATLAPEIWSPSFVLDTTFVLNTAWVQAPCYHAMLSAFSRTCFGTFRKTMSDDTLTKMRFIEAYWKRDVGAPLAAARASLVPARP